MGETKQNAEKQHGGRRGKREEREKEVNLTFLDVYKRSVVCQLEVEQSNDLFFRTREHCAKLANCS